jgi:hypothetical protein
MMPEGHYQSNLLILIYILRKECGWKAINCHFLSREIERMKGLPLTGKHFLLPMAK